MDKDCWGDLDFGWPWVELYPQKDVLKSSCLVPVHVTTFGNRVSSNAIRLKGGHVEFGCLVFYKRAEKATWKQRCGHPERKEGCVPKKAGIGVMRLQAKGCLGPPEATRGRKGPPIGPGEGAVAVMSDLWSPD